MKEFTRKMWLAIQMELREHRSSFLVYMTLRGLVIVVMFLQLYNGNYENVFLCLLTLLLLIVPSFVQVTFKVEIPTALEIILLLFIYAAEILGEIQEFYTIFPFWDTILHTMNGFLMAAIGFSMVDLLNRNPKTSFSLSPVFVSVVGFCFSMTIGVVWEFFEYFMDTFFGLDMQKDTVLGGYLDIGLIDTMNDLVVNFFGATIFCIIGYFYVKYRGEGKFAKRFIPTQKEDDKDFLKLAEAKIKQKGTGEKADE